MFKRKKIILSSVALLISFVIMGFGVYAASNPQITITGQVTYTARDAKVLVQGKANGYRDTSTGAQATNDYPTASSPYTNSTKVTNQAGRYLDYTLGIGHNNQSDDLSAWAIGGLNFYEDTTGVKDIVVSFQITNHSAFPVEANLTFKLTDEELESKNVIRTANQTKASLKENGGTTEITVTYTVKNDSQIINALDIAMDLSIINSTISVAEEHTATFNSNDPNIQFLLEGDTFASTYQVTGTTINDPGLMTGSSYSHEPSWRRVAEWYDNPECTGSPISFPYTLTQDKNLYAKWQMNTREFEIKTFNQDSPLSIYVKGREVFRASNPDMLLNMESDMDTLLKYYDNLASPESNGVVLVPKKEVIGLSCKMYIGGLFIWTFVVVPPADETFPNLPSNLTQEQIVELAEKALNTPGYTMYYYYMQNSVINFVTMDINTTGPDVEIYIGKEQIKSTLSFVVLD